MEEFFTKLFTILEIPQTEQKQLREDFNEILTNNLLASVLINLPEEKRTSLIKLVKNGQADQESIKKWAEENQIAGDQEFLGKINSTTSQSINDFFTALVADVDGQKMEELIAFAKSFKNE